MEENPSYQDGYNRYIDVDDNNLYRESKKAYI